MDEQKSIINEFFRLTAISFAFAILFMSAVGWIFGDTVQESTAAFELGGDGLPFATIFGVLLMAVINSSIAVFITSAKIFDKLLLLWKMIIIMFSCLTATGVLTVALRWIDRESWEAWLWFIVSFVVSFIIAAAIMAIKVILENRRYNDLLSDYKKEQENVK